MHLLELFSGTKSLGKVFQRKGWKCTSVDIDVKTDPTIVADVCSWDYWKYPIGYFDVIHASPPCTQYSRARTCGGKRKLDEADKIVERIFEIIKYFQPKY